MRLVSGQCARVGPLVGIRAGRVRVACVRDICLYRRMRVACLRSCVLGLKARHSFTRSCQMKAVAWVLLAVAAAAPVPAPPPPGPPNLGHIRPLLHLRGGSDGRGAPAAVDGAAVPDAFNYESLFDGCRFGHGMIRVMNATAMDAFLRGELGMQLLRKEEYQRFGRVSVKLNDAAKDVSVYVSVCMCVCVCVFVFVYSAHQLLGHGQGVDCQGEGHEP